MRPIIPLMILVLALGTAQGFPLSGTNGVQDCVVFDAFKNGLSTEDNVSSEVLYVDVGLTGSYNVTFHIIDTNDNKYPLDFNYSQALQAGRLILAFPMPTGTDVKALEVVPIDSETFTVSWDQVAKYTNGLVNIRNYGTADWMVSANLQALTLDVSVANNDSSKTILISPANFTLIDQWGWRYFADESFTSMQLPPKNYLRTYLTFNGMSPLSHPVAFEFDYYKDDGITVPLDITAFMTSSASAQDVASNDTLASNVQSGSTAVEQPVSSSATTEVASGVGQTATEQKTTADKVTEARDKLASIDLKLHGI